MRYLLTILLFLSFSLASFSQMDEPFMHFTFDSTLVNAGSSGGSLKAYGNATFDPTNKAIGTASGVMDGSNDYWRIPIADLGDEAIIAFWAWTNIISANIKTIFTIADPSDYFFMTNLSYNEMRLYTTGGNSARSATITNSVWTHYVYYYNKPAGICRMWQDKVRVALTDSVIATSFNTNDSMFIGVDYYRNGDWTGNIDDIRVYKDIEPTQAQIDSIYDPSINLTYSPPQFVPSNRFLGRSRPSYGVSTRYMTYGVPSYSQIAALDYGYDSTYVLACKQKFLIPENVDNGDYVGTWLKTWTWRSSGAISYSLQSHTDRFAINSSTGLITVSDASKIDGKIVAQDTAYNLIVRTTDAILGYEDDTAQVWIKENAYCVFLDYGQGTNGSGARTSPEKDIHDITLTPGRGYFFKRGSIILNESLIDFGTHIASAANPTVMGAYGTGNKPKFYDSGTDNNTQFRFGTLYDAAPWYDAEPTHASKYIYLYDMVWQNFYAAAVRSYIPACEIGFYNIEMYDNCRGGSESAITYNVMAFHDSVAYRPIELINCIMDTVASTALSTAEPSYLKLGAGPAYITNCYFGPLRTSYTTGWAARLTNGKGHIVKHSYFNAIAPTHTTSSGNVQCRGESPTFIDNYFESSSNGIMFMTNAEIYTTPDNVTVRNCSFKNQTYRSIYFELTNSTFAPYDDILIENSKFKGGVNHVFIRDSERAVIRRNQLLGGTGIGINTSATYTNNSAQIYYNLITGYTGDEIQMNNGATLAVYNNTVNGSINVSGITSLTAKNNIYRSLTYSGTPTFAKNLDLDEYDVSLFFTNYPSDFSLISTATAAINNGENLSLLYDIRGTAVGTTPDIGAYNIP